MGRIIPLILVLFSAYGVCCPFHPVKSGFPQLASQSTDLRPARSIQGTLGFVPDEENQAFRQAMNESDPGKKLMELRSFLAQHPDSGLTLRVFEELEHTMAWYLEPQAERYKQVLSARAIAHPEPPSGNVVALAAE